LNWLKVLLFRFFNKLFPRPGLLTPHKLEILHKKYPRGVERWLYKLCLEGLEAGKITIDGGGDGFVAYLQILDQRGEDDAVQECETA